MSDTELEQDDSDDSLIDEIPEDIVTNLALIGGGYLLLSSLLSNDEEAVVEQRAKDIRRDIRAELENAGQFSDAELESKVTKYRDMVAAGNEQAPSGCEVNVTEVENELAGEPLHVQALTWKEMAHRVTICYLQELQGQPTWYQALPKWAQNYVELMAKATGAGVVVIVLLKLWQLGGGGGGGGGVIHTLRDWTRIVRDGVIGDPTVPDVIEDDPDPIEQPEPTPEGTVEGSLRSAGNVVGAATAVLTRIAVHMGVGVTTILVVGEAAIDGLAAISDKNAQWFRDHPAETILLAAAVAAGIALAAADGPFPFGDAAAVALVATVAASVGVAITGEALGQAAHDVADNLTEQGTSATGGLQF